MLLYSRKIHVLRQLVRRGAVTITVRSDNEDEVIYRSINRSPGDCTFDDVVRRLKNSQNGRINFDVCPHPAGSTPFTTGNRRLNRIAGRQLGRIETRESVAAAQVNVRGMAGRHMIEIRNALWSISSTDHGVPIASVITVRLLVITEGGTILVGIDRV